MSRPSVCIPPDNRGCWGHSKRLRDLGNTLIVVGHDREVIGSADYLLDSVPELEIRVARSRPRGREAGAAREGVADGQYLSARRRLRCRQTAAWRAGSVMTPVAVPGVNTPRSPDRARRAPSNNLKNTTSPFRWARSSPSPASAAPASRRWSRGLYNTLARRRIAPRLPAPPTTTSRARSDRQGHHVDQQPIGNTRRRTRPPTPAFSISFPALRPVAGGEGAAGYQPRRFSFNAPGGRCERARANGQRRSRCTSCRRLGRVRRLQWPAHT